MRSFSFSLSFLLSRLRSPDLPRARSLSFPSSAEVYERFEDVPRPQSGEQRPSTDLTSASGSSSAFRYSPRRAAEGEFSTCTALGEAAAKRDMEVRSSSHSRSPSGTRGWGRPNARKTPCRCSSASAGSATFPQRDGRDAPARATLGARCGGGGGGKAGPAPRGLVERVLAGAGRRTPKILMHLPLREGFDQVASIGTTCATSSAVAAGAGAAIGTAIGSGAFLGRGLNMAFVAVIVLDKGR